MDSGNSGSLSLQSSSGGDDEYDSRYGGGDSSPLSALLRQPPAPSTSVLPCFGGGSFYGGIHQELATTQLSHHAAHCWPSSSTPHPAAGTTTGGVVVPPSSSSSCQGAAAASSAAAPAAAPPTPRGSRKRTRASRRAPTTVLTTDTSNFRAMVQEFTGIPAPPFAARPRFDHHLIFPSRSSAGTGALVSPYLLRPSAHKHRASSPYYYPPYLTNKAIASTSAAPSTSPAVASRDVSYHHHASAPSAVLGTMQQDLVGGGNYLSTFQSHTGAQLVDGNAARYAAHGVQYPMFDAAAQRLPDQAGFSGLAHHGAMNNSEATTHLHRGLGYGGDELSGLVGARSGSSAADCLKTTTYSSGAGPLLERNAQSTATVVAGAASTTTTAAMRAPPGVESWICTSSD